MPPNPHNDLSEWPWLGVTLNGRYQIELPLSAGGMGLVYRGLDLQSNTPIVVKTPRAETMQSNLAVKRFVDEVRSVVALRHPHIVPITDVGIHEDLPYAVMPLLTGGNLQGRWPTDAKGTRQPMLPDTLGSWLPGVAAALDWIHSKGFVHRDVKPGNVMFNAYGQAFLGDFGVAKAFRQDEEIEFSERYAQTSTGMIIGTSEYMSPEGVFGEPHDGRSDQYGLGVMVFEALTGRRPFIGPTGVAVMLQHSAAIPPSVLEFQPNLPVEVADAVNRALSKRPEDRFPDCIHFARAVLKPMDQASKLDVRRLACPVCDVVVKIRSSSAGKVVRCPSCENRLRVSQDLRRLRQPDASSPVSAPRRADPEPSTPDHALGPLPSAAPPPGPESERDRVGSMSIPLLDSSDDFDLSSGESDPSTEIDLTETDSQASNGRGPGIFLGPLGLFVLLHVIALLVLASYFLGVEVGKSEREPPPSSPIVDTSPPTAEAPSPVPAPASEDGLSDDPAPSSP